MGPVPGRYKTVLITNEDQFTYITKYIHRNPIDLLPSRPGLEGLADYKYSSYGNYLGLFKQGWVKTDDILAYFQRLIKEYLPVVCRETGDISGFILR